MCSSSCEKPDPKKEVGVRNWGESRGRMFDVRLYMASACTQLQDRMVVLVTSLQSLMGIPVASMS